MNEEEFKDISQPVPAVDKPYQEALKKSSGTDLLEGEDSEAHIPTIEEVASAVE